MSDPVQPSHPYITCEEVITFLLAYLSKELPPEKEHEFERHLAVCPSCVAYIETYRTTVSLGQRACALDDDEAPPELGEALLSAILASRPPQS
jgi:anti-sigma factor RsiW